MPRRLRKKGRSLLLKSPDAHPRIASPPTKGILATTKLMYRPPVAPVTSPPTGSTRIPLMRIGSCVKCTMIPGAKGIAIGGNDRMLAEATVRAMKVSVCVFVAL